MEAFIKKPKGKEKKERRRIDQLEDITTKIKTDINNDLISTIVFELYIYSLIYSQDILTSNEDVEIPRRKEIGP